MKRALLVLNGPGLADLSLYENLWFGTLTLDDIREACRATCHELGHDLDFRQTDDHEELYRWIVEDGEAFDGLVINPAGRSTETTGTLEKYRTAIRKIAALDKHIPIIEVHIDNVFRGSEAADQRLDEPEGNKGFVCGLGRSGYTLAIQAIDRQLRQPASA